MKKKEKIYNILLLFTFLSVFVLISIGCTSRGSSGIASALNSKLRITFDSQNKLLRFYSNGIPAHNTGSFPNPGNPNSIREQSIIKNVPVNPLKNPTASPSNISAQGKIFAIGVNGVLFDPFTAEFYDSEKRRRVFGRTERHGETLLWNYDGLGASNRGEALGMDFNLAHVQPDGTYHYHGNPISLDTGSDTAHSPLMALAGDGYPVFGQYGYNSVGSIEKMQSCWVTKSQNPRKSIASEIPPPVTEKLPLGTFVQDYEYDSNCTALDASNGHYGVVPKDAMENYLQYFDSNSYTDTGDAFLTIYHYHLTETYPYMARSFAGTPNRSFSKRPLPGAPRSRQ